MDARAILNILMGLGWRHVVLVSDLETRHLTNVYHELTSNGIFTQLQSVNESLQQGYSLRLEAIPYIVIGDMRRHVQIMEKYGSYRKPPLTFALMTSDEELFLTVKVSTSFYLINPAKESLTYIQTFAHSDHVVSNIWIRNESTGFYQPEFNLQGAPFRVATLSYEPWLSVSDCNPAGKNCHTSGILHDLTNLLGQWFNFTWSCNLPKDEIWGNFPVEAHNWSLAALENATGSVYDSLTGVSDSPLSAFRAEWFDFPWAMSHNTYDAILSLKRPSTDYTLLLRPLTGLTWLFVCLIVLLVTCLLAFMSRWHYASGARDLTLTVLGLLHLFVMAFYSGAMTSYFSSPVALPFKSIVDGIMTYPEYKMVTVKG